MMKKPVIQSVDFAEEWIVPRYAIDMYQLLAISLIRLRMFVITVRIEKKVILLEIELDEEICSILDYFEIFLQRMLMCKRAAEILGLKFKMKANGNKIC